MFAFFRHLFAAPNRTPPQVNKEPPMPRKLRSRLAEAAARAKVDVPPDPYAYPVKLPDLMPGVVPSGNHPAIAMDSAFTSFMAAYTGGSTVVGFPGYPYLSQLAARAEYRAFASTMSTEMTREWIELTSSDDEGGGKSNERIKVIEGELDRLKLREVIAKAVADDCFFGRTQIYFDLGNPLDDKTPLLISKHTVPLNSLKRICAVEAIWTTPSAYNAQDPTAPDFYKPSEWFVLGRQTHASRLHTIITRPVPDMLKPAFNFGGISLSQLAEPYVDNWLRTRQSVADLINNFSITALKTSMSQVLEGSDDATDLYNRAAMFTATRSNKGLMLLDKDFEDLVQINVPLGGLHELQAQAQEHMCSVSRTPAIILTGISPSGLNASSEGEIRVFYDWIAAQQEAHWRSPIDTAIKLIQLSKFGDIDETIGFTFKPLYQMTPKEEAEIREINSRVDVAYIDAGVLDPAEPRERLARDHSSGYQSLDVDAVIVAPGDDLDPLGGGDGPEA